MVGVMNKENSIEIIDFLLSRMSAQELETLWEELNTYTAAISHANAVMLHDRILQEAVVNRGYECKITMKTNNEI